MQPLVFAAEALHGAASSKAPVLLGSKFLSLFDCRELAICHPLGNRKTDLLEQPARKLLALWGVLNEIVQSLINAGVDWLLYQLALDYSKGALF